MNPIYARVLLGSLCLAAFNAPQAQAQQKTATIGIVTAQSGPLAAAGKFQMNGFNLAVDAINQQGFKIGADTYKVALQVYDTRCNAAEGSSAMQRLITIDKAPIVLGELCSPVAAAEGPIAQDYSVPLMITVPTAPDLTEQNNPHFFRINANNDQLNKALADFVASKNLAPLAFIAWNNDAGRGGIAGMKKYLPKDFQFGYTGYFNVGEVDFSSHVANIKAGGAKAVMLLMDEEPGALAIRQTRDAGVNAAFIGTLAMGSNRFLDRLDAKYLNGMVQYNAFPPNSPVERIRNFNSKYKERFNEESHGFAAQSYDAVFAATKAMTAAGTATDGKAIRDALTKLTFDGVIGPIKFDEKNQASPPVYITEWCPDGSRKVLFPADMASACGGG